MIGKAEDLILLKFDLVILANFNQINGESSSAISKWVNEQTLRKLNINSSKIKSSIARYYFYLFLHNSKVVITRAKRQDGKSSSLSSNLLLKLQFILGKNLTVQSDLLAGNSAIQVKSEIIDDKISSPIFPSILSVTDIEMLVRNPYSFYAKKILNLRSKDMVGEEPKISEFGNFIHRALEQYSKNYDQLINHKVETILNISNNILENVILPPYTKKIWQTKFVAIAQPFIDFDQKRRRGCKYVYSERKGEILLNIAGQDLKITGVADRIEVDNLGRAIIIDYKTGALPSKKDVESGLSSQLIIEALMLQQGGFQIKVDNIKQLIYVKISSSEPYIQTLEIDLTKEDLQYHKQAMVTLLKYYITNKSFVYNIDLLKYNDYKHLARMI
jgi:ATP-dependent helicase/nuclease subunit B